MFQSSRHAFPHWAAYLRFTLSNKPHSPLNRSLYPPPWLRPVSAAAVLSCRRPVHPVSAAGAGQTWVEAACRGRWNHHRCMVNTENRSVLMYRNETTFVYLNLVYLRDCRSFLWFHFPRQRNFANIDLVNLLCTTWLVCMKNVLELIKPTLYLQDLVAVSKVMGYLYRYLCDQVDVITLQWLYPEISRQVANRLCILRSLHRDLSTKTRDSERLVWSRSFPSHT